MTRTTRLAQFDDHPLTILIVGAEPHRDAVRRTMPAGRTCAIEVRKKLPAAERLFDILVVFLEWPDQYTLAEIEQLFGAFPEARIVCVATEWCAAMNRSRGLWPLASVTSWDQLSSRLACELAIFDGTIPAVPPSAGREELLEATFQATGHSDLNSSVPICIDTSDAALRHWLQDGATAQGLRVQESAQDAAGMFSVIDGDPWTEDTASRAVQANDSGGCLVLTSDLNCSHHPANLLEVPVASKYSPVSECLRMFSAVVLIFAMLAGCGRQPAARVSQSGAPSARWQKVIQEVRSAQSKQIETNATVSSEDWAALKTGCESLEFLEAPNAAITDEDLDLSKSLPNLKRLVLDAPVGDRGAELLAQYPSLNQLNLAKATLSDAGLRHLSRLPLIQLRIGSPNLTDDGMKSLADLKKLRFLHFVDVPITDAGLPAIAAIESLESFYLDGGKCTEEGLGKLLEAKPGLHFHLDQMHLPDDPHKHPH